MAAWRRLKLGNMNPIAGPIPTSHASEIDSEIVAVPLRIPGPYRGQNGRTAASQTNLLPVFLAGEENAFVAFVCKNLRSAYSTPDVEQPEAAPGTSDDQPAVSDWPELVPLLLIGPQGCGKTAIASHLAAILLDAAPSVPAGAESVAKEPAAMLLSGVDFARLYAKAVEADDLVRFRNEIDRAAVLVVDDVHLMVSKPASQDELAARIEFRVSDGRPTIVTCRRLPSQVTGLRPLLVSRMLPGLTVPIRLPGPATRRALLTEFARRRSLQIGEEELRMLESGLSPELPTRALDSAIANVDLHCRMKGCRPDIHAIRNAILSMETTGDLSIDRIAKTVARRFKLKLADLKSGTRRQEVVRARSLAMHLMRTLTHASYHQIGHYFGGRDHTTVLHACRKTSSQLADDSDLKLAAEEVTEHLKTPE